jgi:hypothetical protein
VLELGNLPSGPSVLRLDGSSLWLGGSGYIALYDLDKKKVLKVCYVPTRVIDDLQIGGAYLWVQFNGTLYRAHLASLQEISNR